VMESHLDKLQLSMDMMAQDAANHLALALEHNHRLRELSIQLNENHSESFDMNVIADMLRTNRGLEWMELSRSLWNDDAAQALAEALKHNESLKVLFMNFDTPGLVKITDKGYQYLLEMLKVNHTVEAIPTLGLFDESLRSKLNLFLKLNDRGVRRIRLSLNTSHNAFLDVLEKESDDLDCVYYLLSMNPLLFDGLDLGDNDNGMLPLHIC